jgi:citrate synthase
LDKHLHRDYVSATEAMKLLEVKPQTLYAYVSRGWIHSVSQKGMKEKLYSREDILRVSTRSLARSGHTAVAASAMNWGEPIFPTSITEITAEGPRYRGHLAAELARSGTSFEALAELLWSGELTPQSPRWTVTRPAAEPVRLTQSMSMLNADQNVLESFALVVLLLGMGRGPVVKRLLKGQTLPAAREIIQTMVACCGFAGPACMYRPMLKGQSVVEGLMQSLAMVPDVENFDALRKLLILLADHELSPGTLKMEQRGHTVGTGQRRGIWPHGFHLDAEPQHRAPRRKADSDGLCLDQQRQPAFHGRTLWWHQAIRHGTRGVFCRAA